MKNTVCMGKGQWEQYRGKPDLAWMNRQTVRRIIGSDDIRIFQVMQGKKRNILLVYHQFI